MPSAVPLEELHIVQQLRYAPQEYQGGFYLSTPKGGSAGTVDLDPMVASALRRHMQEYPPTEVELTDVTSGNPVRRRVPLLFTTTHKNPFTDRTWSAEWVKWRERAGWPKEHGGFHALRHFFATTLITNHVDPKEVQRALRHSTLQITLETYVHFGHAGSVDAVSWVTCCGLPPAARTIGDVVPRWSG